METALPEVMINKAVYTIDLRLQEARRITSHGVSFIPLDSRAGETILNEYYKEVE